MQVYQTAMGEWFPELRDVERNFDHDRFSLSHHLGVLTPTLVTSDPLVAMGPGGAIFRLPAAGPLLPRFQTFTDYPVTRAPFYPVILLNIKKR
ncbi:hypothetical protein SAMN00790413_03809 [Deinococcus hopiensis KR-140]|uniref:Uncharacterized protein n=1 Tax=Deinococcus hopiensis KR-140 TaxID=695939 RepID=A0A1W1UZD2_9DEIO|nr:hypothetical protein SAMN00790413_03809 [Deinococcus hopiensis KR-140]